MVGRRKGDEEVPDETVQCLTKTSAEMDVEVNIRAFFLSIIGRWRVLSSLFSVLTVSLTILLL